MRGIDALRDGLLELRDSWTLGDPAGPKCSNDLAFFFFVERWTGDRDVVAHEFQPHKAVRTRKCNMSRRVQRISLGRPK